MESTVNRLAHVCFAGVEPLVRRALDRWPARVVAGGSAEGVKEARFLLARAGSPTRKAVPGEAEEANAFLVWLFREAGLDAGAYRSRALERRLPACLRALRAASAEAARGSAEGHPALIQRAVDAVLIGVSGFFRDPAVFEELRRRLLPELLKGRRGLRVQSAGCSDGQELYSIAILLGKLGALKGSYLLGVDCRPEAIARAGAGWYPATELDGVPPALREGCFEVDGARARVSGELREKARWQVGDVLGSEAGAGGWDVILFRNVAIYLKAEQSAALWERWTSQLRPGGVLVTGKAERPPAGLPLKRKAHCVYQKVER